MTLATNLKRCAFSTLLVLSTLFLALTSLSAQVVLNTQTNVELSDDRLVIDITVENFTNIAAMQFTINWDETILELEEILNFQLDGLGPNSFGENLIQQGELSVAWITSDFISGASVADESVLFSLSFNVLSNVPTEIYFDDNPTYIEIIRIDGELLGLESTTNSIQTSGRLLDGQVFIDEQGDCAFQDGEVGLEHWMVEINNGTNSFFRRTNAEGIFTAFLKPGTYTVTLLYPENNYWVACQTEEQITIVEDGQETVTVAFGVAPVLDCPALSVDISTPFIRRCFDNVYQVAYCNQGTAIAEAAYVAVQLPAEFTLKTSVLPYTLEGDNLYRFEIGDVAMNDCGRFSFMVGVDCDNTELGQTHCVTAQIFPAEICTTENLQWDEASLAIKGECQEEVIQFEIKNVGAGDMTAPAQFVIIEDMLMRQQANEPFQLVSGASVAVELPANGTTYRVEADQVPFHPTSRRIAAAVEGCGINAQGTFSKGFITMFEAGDDSPFMDIDCQENIGAFDPNDKRAYPAGYGAPHYLDQNKTLTYHIRFQNTGTDTAFNIIVLDTLSKHLAVSSFTPLTASHDYKVEILKENIVKYSFDNIMLVDSVKNEPLSHGFIRFKIDQQPDVELGTVITNDAAIYFDFNEPVITNKTTHTIGKDFIELAISTSTTDRPALKMAIAPNPFSLATKVTIEDFDNREGTFLLYDLNGRLLKTYSFKGNEFELQRSDLETGLYLFKVYADGALEGNGKLSVK